MFNTILNQAGVDPNKVPVAILRHKDSRSAADRTPYQLWRDHRTDFVEYQSRQSARSFFMRAKILAAFVVTPNDETLFAGLYNSSFQKEGDVDLPKVQNPHETDRAGAYAVFKLQAMSELEDLQGRIVIDWGRGFLAWNQWAQNQNKAIIEIRRKFEEADFPGFARFIEPLSSIAVIPPRWQEVLSTSTGIYLLTCPRTNELYVGSATGAGGFYSRFMEYVRTGTGGNIKLKRREISDYQVSILHAAGTAETDNDILALEQLWMRKLQTREMGLNSGGKQRAHTDELKDPPTALE
jgi:hypothetical protein